MKPYIYPMLFFSVFLTACTGMNEHSFSRFGFDTAVTVRYKGSENAEDMIKDKLTAADSRLSMYSEDSAVYRINHGSVYDKSDDSDIAVLLDGYAEHERLFGKGVTPFCGTLTALWDITSDNPQVPSDEEISESLKYVYNSCDYNDIIPEKAVIDFGSGAKGYVCDIMLDISRENNLDEMIFSAGSSALLWSRDDRAFSTDIVNPTADNEYIRIITKNAFISTSGGYERYFEDNGKKYTHIMDIETGYPVETDIASVTVILSCSNRNGLASDLLSTHIYAAGTEQLDRFSHICEENYEDFGILVITENGEVLTRGEVNIS